MKLNRISQRHWTILCLNRSSLPKWSVRTMKCHIIFNSKFKFLSEMVRIIFFWRCSSGLLRLYISFIATALFRMAWRLPHLSWNYCEWPLILHADNRCSQLRYFFFRKNGSKKGFTYHLYSCPLRKNKENSVSRKSRASKKPRYHISFLRVTWTTHQTDTIMWLANISLVNKAFTMYDGEDIGF